MCVGELFEDILSWLRHVKLFFLVNLSIFGQSITYKIKVFIDILLIVPHCHHSEAAWSSG